MKDMAARVVKRGSEPKKITDEATIAAIQAIARRHLKRVAAEKTAA